MGGNTEARTPVHDVRTLIGPLFEPLGKILEIARIGARTRLSGTVWTVLALLTCTGGACPGQAAEVHRNDPATSPESSRAPETSRSPQGGQTFEWGQIKASASSAICLSANCGVTFGDQFCHNPRNGAVDELVDSVLRDIIGLFMSIPPLYRYQPSGVQDACQLEDQEPRRRAAAESVLADTEFMRAFLPKLATALKARSALCPDCPPVPVRALRELSWSDLSFYFTTFVVPHVRTRGGGQVDVVFKICSGSEAASQIPNADVGLLRLGLFIAQRVEAVREMTGDEMSNAMADPGFGQLGSDPERNTYLKQRVAERLVTDPTVRGAVCRLLSDYRIALGVDVPECRLATRR